MAAQADTANSRRLAVLHRAGPAADRAVAHQAARRIYFGEYSPHVLDRRRADRARKPRELDRPPTTPPVSRTTPTAAAAACQIGSTWRQLLYAWKFKDKNILLSSGVNSASRILYVRDPRQRVAKVAPWLTLDGDPYPVVVDGQIVWVVDGYTTTRRFPVLRAGVARHLDADVADDQRRLGRGAEQQRRSTTSATR